ncbi:MAG TPA: acetyl-CoA carboxylase biotin carboxylase subunit [Nitrospirales bacterium]|nr:acetyl-CoA carboxylase biotin carboxylase subunit [Nitrospirales bacterium]
MFKKILVANRGEIAVRVIRACKELGIRSVAVHSEVDNDSLHVRSADEHLCIGPADPALSYCNIPNILSAAEITACDAVHPGYGFLAENAHFAEVCESIGIKFIGPTSENIGTMGDKAKARDMMSRHGLPVLPGSEGVIASEQEAAEVAAKIGYPVIIKASAGGGGRGMRVVNKEDELAHAFQAARAEANAAFGNQSVYVERYFLEPRHIEVQILADERGRTIYLGERDCSVQRRYQKLLEETPSPAVDDRLRRELGRVAVEAAQAVRYRNAGTVEFLLDKERRFYFMEMNTRIQVEHPITEEVTGIDLVKEQIRIAAGLPLSWKQQDVKMIGHSIECRINAECPDTFTPCAGLITRCHPPGGPGVRVDTAIETGSKITSHYDSLIAKLIVHGLTRDEALARMRRALDECVVEGIKTTIPLHRRILDDPDFQKGRFSTAFLERFSSPPPTS